MYDTFSTTNLRPITPSSSTKSITGRLRSSIASETAERKLRQRHQLTMIRSRLSSSLHDFNRRRTTDDDQRPSTSPQHVVPHNFDRGILGYERPSTTPLVPTLPLSPTTSPTNIHRSRTSPAMHIHSTRKRRKNGEWQLQQRLAPIPGFARPHPPTTTTTTTPSSTTSSSSKFVGIQLKYTKWMKRARHMSATKPGYVCDERALRTTFDTKDRLLVCTHPRAGQPMETLVHVQARRLQRNFRRYLIALRNWAANVIIRSWRCHKSKKILQQHRAAKKKNENIIQRMHMLRLSRRMRGWRSETELQLAIISVGKRFFHSSNTSLTRWCFDRWLDIYEDICQKNQHTIECFHRYMRHKKKCRAWLELQEHAWLQRALRNFLIKRNFQQWRRNVREIVVTRNFGTESRAAIRIQRCYRKMRERDLLLMIEMECEGDVIEFKEHRRIMTIRVQCRARIMLAHKAFDARRSARHAVKYILTAVKRRCMMVDAREERERRRRNEAIRTDDENNYINAYVLERYENMSFDGGWWWWKKKNSWCRTSEGKEARKRAGKIMEKRRSERAISKTALLEMKKKKIKKKKMNIIRATLVEMRLELTREKARELFRKRWPPFFCCKKCGESFGIDGERHSCSFV